MCLKHVLAVLEDDESRLWSALDRAIELADAEHARLTLAKTTDPGWLMRWFAPAGLHAMCVPAEELDTRVAASHKLARAAEFVPAWIPVTTLLLGQSTAHALAEMVQRGCYDAVVTPEGLLRHSRRLRTELRRLGIETVVAGCRASSPVGMATMNSQRDLRGAIH